MGADVTAGSLNVTSTATNTSEAKTIAFGIGVAAGNAAVADASITTGVEASVAGAGVTLTGSGLVDSTSNNTATARRVTRWPRSSPCPTPRSWPANWTRWRRR